MTTTTYRTKFHRDGSITVWNVYTQSWERTSRPSDRVLASLEPKERDRVRRHCGL
jgi:hypothetical protein